MVSATAWHPRVYQLCRMINTMGRQGSARPRVPCSCPSTSLKPMPTAPRGHCPSSRFQSHFSHDTRGMSAPTPLTRAMLCSILLSPMAWRSQASQLPSPGAPRLTQGSTWTCKGLVGRITTRHRLGLPARAMVVDKHAIRQSEPQDAQWHA